MVPLNQLTKQLRALIATEEINDLSKIRIRTRWKNSNNRKNNTFSVVNTLKATKFEDSKVIVNHPFKSSPTH